VFVEVAVCAGVPVAVAVGVAHAPPDATETLSTVKLAFPLVGPVYVKRRACDPPLANALISNVRSVYAVSATEGSVKVAIVVPSILTVSVSVNGVVTTPIFIWKLSVADPAGMVTLCPSVAVSGAPTPPNHDHRVPANGPAAEPPVPQLEVSQSGVPKLLEVCTVHAGHGAPASNVPSAIRSEGVHAGEGDDEGVPVGVFVAVLVDVFVGVAVAVGAGVPPPHPLVVR
jgi:hypothetical protein